MGNGKLYVSVDTENHITDELVKMANPENEFTGKLVSAENDDIHDVRDLLELNPVSSDGEVEYSEWECHPEQTSDGKTLSVEEDVDGKWILCSSDGESGESTPLAQSKGRTSSVFLQWDVNGTRITARRTAENLVGYRLGSKNGQNEGKTLGLPTSLIDRVTWSELAELKNAEKLVPGKLYRITDYVATTNGEGDSASANRPFDVVVRALSENLLSEVASAIQRDGDRYFNESNLVSWKLWYCFDNDTDRFAWAVQGGRGVVYRLIDEFGNDAPYDFKGIQFNTHEIEGQETFRYTFDDGGQINQNSDASKRGIDNGVYDNSILSWLDITQQVKRQHLNNVVIMGTRNYAITMQHGCHDIRIGKNGQGMVGQCFDTKFGHSCYGITLGNICQSNEFDDLSYDVEMGDNCSYNRFQTSCYTIRMGNNCIHNVFSTYCNDIHFGNSCKWNTIGNSSARIYCGDEIWRCEFGKGLFNVTFGLTGSNGERTVQSSYYSIEVEDSVQWVDLYCNADRQVSQQDPSLYPYRSVTVKKGIKGTGQDGIKVIEDRNFNQPFNTVYQPQGQLTISI